ncbi:NADH-quinone oxidoreductase subunit N, partial [Streptomyces sp. NPDC059456]
MAAAHGLLTLAAAEPADRIPAPHIEYAQLAPTLIVVGAAVLGVLVEAFVPRKSRYYVQVFLAVAARAAAVAAVVGLAPAGGGGGQSANAARGAGGG